VESRSVTMLP